MQIEEAKKYCKQIKDRDLWKVGYVYGSEAIETVLNELDKKDNYIETMHKEFDRLEGIEDNTSMLLKELVETKEHNRQLGIEIAKLNNRCKKLDREAQSYLEELMGDSTLKDRTINQLNNELEKKNKVIDEMAEWINKQDIDEEICKNNITQPELCNAWCTNCIKCIKEYFYKKVSDNK